MNFDAARFSDAPPERIVADITRNSGSSFYWAMRLLPRYKRSAMYAIYAFCRQVDDIADGGDEILVKQTALAAWKNSIENLYDGAPDNAISTALQSHIRRFKLQKSDFLDVIDGMLMDAVPELSIRDLEELNVYCDRVACAVGRLSVSVFEIDLEVGYRLAASLGLALQFTNILRDVAEDRKRNHIYLPADMLSARGIGVDNLLEPALRQGLSEVCDQIAVMAAAHFKEAERLMELCDKTRIRPAMIMKNVYRKIYARVLDRGWERLNEPVALSKFEKSALIVKTALLSH
ncbi:MAG: presqualene diphosphate synthase HpnD [Rhodospirillales bacterium]|jgi:phytoene synthase|nr:presqualene diphosphate synthase HpnD [Rhodospirillales bacterium]|tara:strand:+ start:3255 stop:4124 length:870 start_codon:yes stop_codon:yes gene_type:complete